MNKFKKILLGTLSVLTLGLFVVTGTKVNAATAIEEKDYHIKAEDFFDELSNSKTKPTRTTATPLTIPNDKTYIISTYGTNSAGSSAAISNPSKFDDSGWNWEFYMGGNKTFTITAGDEQKIHCAVYAYGSSTSKSVKFGDEAAITCSAANTLYKFENTTDLIGTMSIAFTDKITIMEIVITISPSITNAQRITAAETAIDAIPATTDDLDAYKTALDAAEAAIDLCDGGINDLPAAYQTKYNDAVAAYNEAYAAVAVDLAKDAIDAIPATTDDLDAYKTALDAAKDAIEACENGINSLPAAYQTKYNDAVAAYNTANYNAQVAANNARFGQTSSFTANDVAEGAESNTVVSGGTSYIGSSIFIGANFTKQIVDSKNNSTAATILGTNYNGRLNTKSKTSIKFTTESAGAIAFLAMSGSASDATRTLHLYAENGTTSLGSVTVATTVDTVVIQTINVPSAGTYYIGADGSNAINIYDVSFISSSTKALSQSYTEDGYTYIRFVNIVKGAATLTTSNFNFSVTMTYAGTTNTKTVDYTSDSYVVKKITKSGDDYVDTVNNADYTFADHTAEYYVVFVLRLTTSKFKGSSVCGDFTYGGLTIHSTSRTI